MPELAPVLAACGISVAAPITVETEAAAGDAASHMGFPVALKIVSPEISHKTELGGVRLGLATPAEVVDAARSMRERVGRARPDARITGFALQPMVAPGIEMLLGSVRDPQFGPLVMVGFGGIYVEIFRDTATRLAPVDATEARAMLDELRLAALLHGARGHPAVDLLSLVDTIARFSRLVVDEPALTELEINPLVVSASGVIAVDARAALAAG